MSMSPPAPPFWVPPSSPNVESIAQQRSLHQHSLNDQEGSRDITQEGRKLRPNAVQRPLDPPPPYLPFRDQPGKAGDHSRRTPRIILLASRVILLCDSFWLWRYKSTIELDTSAHTFLNDLFQNSNSHVFMNVEIFSKKESSCHQLHS